MSCRSLGRSLRQLCPLKYSMIRTVYYIRCVSSGGKLTRWGSIIFHVFLGLINKWICSFSFIQIKLLIILFDNFYQVFQILRIWSVSKRKTKDWPWYIITLWLESELIGRARRWRSRFTTGLSSTSWKENEFQ